MGFFKAYDMRGRFGVDFRPETVYEIGRALPSVVGGPRWLVGRDGRVTSPAVRDALVSGLSAVGAEVADMGLATTPMVYFFTAEDGFDGSAMVTASHNPPEDNGIKVSRKGAMPVGYADGLDEVERIVRNAGASAPAWKPGVAEGAGGNWIERYVGWQRSATDDSSFASLRYAVDCSNGMASLVARELFPGAKLVNDRIDGAFPAHSPNPLKAESRQQLAGIVRGEGLDFGILFDGDADRCVFVDERGEFVQPDYLIPIVARATGGAAGPGGERPKAVHDVRTSRGAIEALVECGFEPVMVPVGHAFAKPAMRRLGAAAGGELAGHYYFGEFFGCDSGVLAARRIAKEVARAKAGGLTFSGMVAPISGRYANSGELNFRVDDKDAAIARVLACGASLSSNETSRTDMDGVRVDFAEGWFNVRKSNTEPYLRLVVECDGAGRLSEWVGRLREAIGEAKGG